MNAVVVDTHAIVWALLERSRLSGMALAALELAIRTRSAVYVPAISIVEITYLVEKGRLLPKVKERLLAELDDPASTLRAAALDRDIADRVEDIPRDIVPDMPDRIIAATALHLSLPLVTRDRRIRATDLKTIW
jgi:PIN domain nuclease of toxin-antitoxin system